MPTHRTPTLPPTRKPSKRQWVVIVATLVAAALIAALVAGEVFARHMVSKCMAEQFQSQLGTKVDIDLSKKPMLLQLVDKKVPYIGIKSDDASFGPARDMKVEARVDDIRITDAADSNGTIGSSSAEVTWSDAGILKTLQEQAFGGLVTNVTSNPGDGTLTFDVIGGMAQLMVLPHVVGDTVQIDTMGAQIMGIGLPTDLVDGVVKTVSDSLQTYPNGMKPTKFTVTDQGIEMSLAGGQFTLPKEQIDFSGCSVVS